MPVDAQVECWLIKIDDFHDNFDDKYRLFAKLP